MDRVSDSLTTFRAVLYTLLIYVSTAVVLSYFNKVSFSAADILLSAIWLVIVSKLLNLLFARLFNVPPNHESDIITALILTLILSPVHNLQGYLVLGACALVAMLSKYVLTYNGRHIFNPAALGAVISGVVFHNYASWWLSGTYMAPIILIGGFLIVRKMRRFSMVLIFIAGYFIYRIFLQHLLFAGTGNVSLHTLYIDAVATPLLFFTSVMLTEPLTSPTKRNNGMVYALIVAVFYSVTKLKVSPEQALLIGNAVAFIIEPNRSLLLKLVSSKSEASGIASFLFQPSKKFQFEAGQYMEWTLPGVAVDARGNRRYLTISSSPTEEDLMFTVKAPPKMSRFKKRLGELNPGQQIVATRLAGDFVLPEDHNLKLVFIAGGVGITPFRSMVKYLVDKKESRDIKLLYSVNTPEEIAFEHLFDQAKDFNIHTTYVTTKSESPKYLHGFINKDLVQNVVGDYRERSFYISGPQGFVAAVRIALLELGISPKNITTDFFPGYN